ncbi:MAG: uroporphyrinogen-III synthase [Actinomycetes bacterium]
MSPSRKTKIGSVALVGAGPADPGLLTVRGAELLAAADVVAANTRHTASLLTAVRPDVELIDTSPDLLTDAELARLLVTHAREGRRVVRLYVGDPFLGCNGAALVTQCTRSHVPVEVVPGVPAATAVPAYAGIPLTDSRRRQVLIVDPTPDPDATDWTAAAAAPVVVVMYATEAIGKAATALVEQGRPGETPVAVTSDGTMTTQRTIVSTLDRVEADVAAAGMTEPAIAVIGGVVEQRERVSWWETRPLFGWKVLVPRTKEQAGALSEQLRDYGAVPVEVPTIAVEPPRSPAPMDRGIKGLFAGRYQWAVFTSVNAVRAVVEKFRDWGLDARAFAGVKIAAVGEQTAEALVSFGIRPDLVPSGEHSSEGLLADFPPYDDVLDPINRVFLPRADIATETLVTGLTGHGWEVEDITAYRTVRAAPPAAATRDAIKTGGFDAVLFTSSSTVRNLVGIAGKPHPSTVIAVIGPQTEKTAEELGLRVDVRAPHASAAALAQALAEWALAQRSPETEQAKPKRVGGSSSSPVKVTSTRPASTQPRSKSTVAKTTKAAAGSRKRSQ